MMNHQDNWVGEDEESLLVRAVINDAEEIVPFLLDIKADSGANIALNIAAVRGKLQILKLLLQYGTNVDATEMLQSAIYPIFYSTPSKVQSIGSPFCNPKKTPLIYATEREHRDVVSEILKYNPDINYRAPGGTNALSQAVRSGNSDIASLLLEAGAKTECYIDDQMQYTPLSEAIINDDVKMIQVLLRYGAQFKFRCRSMFGSDDVHSPQNLAKRKDCVALLYIVGHPLCENMAHITNHKHMIPQFVLDDHEPLLSLTDLCRRKIRAHLVSADGGKHNNLIKEIPRLPLPRRIKQFLFFMENTEEIAKETIEFLDSLI